VNPSWISPGTIKSWWRERERERGRHTFLQLERETEMDWWHETGEEMCRVLPHEVVMKIMSDRRQSEIVLTQERREVMSEVRQKDGNVRHHRGRFLEDSGLEGSIGGSGMYQVKEFAMAGGSAEWYNYQLHHRHGESLMRLYREDRHGLHHLQRQVMVVIYPDEEVVVLDRGETLERFIERCERHHPPVGYLVLDEPQGIFPETYD
jgi:hypothetical protein